MTYLIDLHDNEKIIGFQIDLVARSDKRSDELNDVVAIQNIMVPQGRPDGELWRQC